MVARRKKDEVTELEVAFYKFVAQYELDMRGDKDTSNGNIGMVNTIRLLKQHVQDYPSITWLLAKKPIQTISMGVGVWLVIATLYQFGLLKIIAKIFGLDVP